MRFILALLFLWASPAFAANETTINWGLAAGSNPRSVCVFDLTHTCVSTGTLDSTTHVFTPVGIPASGTVTQVNTGTGLTGGPITTTGTISLGASGVSASAYGSSGNIPVITFDVTGRAIAATTVVSNPIQVNGVAYPASPSTNTIPVVTGTNAITYEAVPIAAGGTGQITAPLARSSVGLNVDEITSHGDSNYVIQPADRVVGTSAALTSPRTWTLPAASAVNAGQSLCVVDPAGGIGATNTLTVSRAGADTINGSTTDVLNAQFTGVCLYSDGVSKWTFIPQAVGAGTGTVTSVGSGAGLTGGPITVSGSLAVTGAAGQILAGATPALTSTPVLGVPASSSGTLGLANGGGGGATITLQNTGATAAYNFVLPTGAGSSGQAMLSAGGASPMTFGTLGVAAGGTGVTSITAHGVAVGAGAGSLVAIAPAAAGLFLQSQGGSADPAYADAITHIVPQVFPNSATYTPSANLLYAIVYCVGSGGGGGGIANGSAGSRSTSGGGGGGATSVAIVSAASIGASQVVTIGAAGVGGTTGGTAGTAGGSVSLGSLCVAPGGSGGGGGAGGAAGAGGVAGTGTFSIPGTSGVPGLNATITTVALIAGSGGASGLGFGAGGQGIVATATGQAGTIYGGAGAGGVTNNGGGGSAGGAGAKGVVIIYEYVAR